MADFVAQHHGPDVTTVEPVPWTLFFNGSSCKKGCGIGLIIVSPRGARFEFSLPIASTSTNNQAEYQAVLKGIELLQEVKADAVEIFGDSLLIVNQLNGEYECNDGVLRAYYEECLELLNEFKAVSIEHIPRLYNEEANKLAQHASGYRPIAEIASSSLANSDRRKEIV